MPKVKNPLFSQEARGGIAGLVYNTWRGINTVKTNTSPTGQGTAKRLAAQAVMSSISKVWASIGDVARAAWNQYATDHPVPDWTGSPKRLTGMNWYVGCNVRNSRMSVGAVTSPPVLPAPDAPGGLSLSVITTDLVADWISPTDAVTSIEFWVVGPHSKGMTAKLEQAQYRASAESDLATGKILAVAAAAGRYTIFARVNDMTEGLGSTWVSTFFDVT